MRNLNWSEHITIIYRKGACHA